MRFVEVRERAHEPKTVAKSAKKKRAGETRLEVRGFVSGNMNERKIRLGNMPFCRVWKGES